MAARGGRRRRAEIRTRERRIVQGITTETVIVCAILHSSRLLVSSDQPSLRKNRTFFRRIACELVARPCSAATGRSKSLLGRASSSPHTRNHCSNNLLLRMHSFFFLFVFAIALLGTVHCFELCIMRVVHDMQLKQSWLERLRWARVLIF